MDKAKLFLDVASDLRKLADSVQKVGISGNEPDQPSPQPEKKAVTLEQVRAVLADKSHDGFTDEVRVLLEKHGAKKLSEIDPANYSALLADAEKLK
ncbi:MAG TPA: rRNA biogenesis protein rrp5 [Caproicibacter sp.]|nr:rRNA biogenesis protein rrp5 [Caproicibacter sp.]